LVGCGSTTTYCISISRERRWRAAGPVPIHHRRCHRHHQQQQRRHHPSIKERQGPHQPQPASACEHHVTEQFHSIWTHPCSFPLAVSSSSSSCPARPATQSLTPPLSPLSLSPCAAGRRPPPRHELTTSSRRRRARTTQYSPTTRAGAGAALCVYCLPLIICLRQGNKGD
jgi:hypothetical protein